jgi:hypothetical protein
MFSGLCFYLTLTIQPPTPGLFKRSFPRAIFFKRRQRTAGVKDACKLAR